MLAEQFSAFDCVKIFFLSFLLFLVVLFYFVFKTGSHNVAQAGLELVILLPQPAKYWDYSHELQCLVSFLFFKMFLVIS
jgi:hypothetical protein